MKLERNRMVEVLFYTAVLTKQFYLLPSGSIGIADLFFAVVRCPGAYHGVEEVVRKFWYQEDFPWVVFLIFAAVINGIYFVRTAKRKFSVTYALLDLFCIPDLDVPDTCIRIRLCGALLGVPDQPGVSDNCFDFRTRALFP